jgi:hypothetical protein
MKFYQFSKDIKSGFLDFCSDIERFNATVCFDFEDSISTSDNCDSKKETHRDLLLQALRDLSPKVSFAEFGFRINPVSSSIYGSDLAALNSIKRLDVLFVPKIEYPTELQRILNDLKSEVNQLIPIIETKRGLENLSSILAVKDHRICNIAFGHCDLNLSMGIFPFFHQDSVEYWEWIDYLNGQCAAFNIGLINSPVLELKNDHLLKDTLYRGMEYTSFRGQITLCKQQTLLGATLNGTNKLNKAHFGSNITKQLVTNNEAHLSSDNKLLCINKAADRILHNHIAIELIELYERYKLTGKSFAVLPGGRLISPQEYCAAVKLMSL